MVKCKAYVERPVFHVVVGHEFHPATEALGDLFGLGYPAVSVSRMLLRVEAKFEEIMDL